MSEKLCNLIGGGMKEMIDLVYPVGRTIICDHNPQDDYPWQIWTQDFKDRFPLGAGDTYAAGSTGGEASHTLSIDEMPRHSHDRIVCQNYCLGDNGLTTNGTEGSAAIIISSGKYNQPAGYYGTNPSGGSTAHNNMPPYKAVCMWTRTA